MKYLASIGLHAERYGFFGFDKALDWSTSP